MTYFITAHTNDRARLIISETRTTDAVIAEIVAATLSEQGFHVVRRQKG